MFELNIGWGKKRIIDIKGMKNGSDVSYGYLLMLKVDINKRTRLIRKCTGTSNGKIQHKLRVGANYMILPLFSHLNQGPSLCNRRIGKRWTQGLTRAMLPASTPPKPVSINRRRKKECQKVNIVSFNETKWMHEKSQGVENMEFWNIKKKIIKHDGKSDT